MSVSEYDAALSQPELDRPRCEAESLADLGEGYSCLVQPYRLVDLLFAHRARPSDDSSLVELHYNTILREPELPSDLQHWRAGLVGIGQFLSLPGGQLSSARSGGDSSRWTRARPLCFGDYFIDLTGCHLCSAVSM